ncbi:MAG: hypothetical protein ACU0BS_08720 [Hasllibacter sp.]
MRALPLLLVLVACSGAQPAFFGVPAQRVEAGGFTFHVRRDGADLELVRTGFVPVAALPQVYVASLEAARYATGCSPIPGSLNGDPAVIRLTVQCDSASPR